jgi:hypothetical protein
MKDDIQHILSGTSQVKHHHLIQTTCSYLKGSQGASSMAKDQQQLKEEETTRLIDYIVNQKLWVENINIDNYVSQGAEQKVYLKDGYCCFYSANTKFINEKTQKSRSPHKNLRNL